MKRGERIEHRMARAASKALKKKLKSTILKFAKTLSNTMMFSTNSVKWCTSIGARSLKAPNIPMTLLKKLFTMSLITCLLSTCPIASHKGEREELKALSHITNIEQTICKLTSTIPAHLGVFILLHLFTKPL